MSETLDQTNRDEVCWLLLCPAEPWEKIKEPQEKMCYADKKFRVNIKKNVS